MLRLQEISSTHPRSHFALNQAVASGAVPDANGCTSNPAKRSRNTSVSSLPGWIHRQALILVRMRRVHEGSFLVQLSAHQLQQNEQCPTLCMFRGCYSFAWSKYTGGNTVVVSDRYTRLSISNQSQRM